jgi:CBS domain-containing protein
MEKTDLLHTIQSACSIGLELIPPTILCDSIGSVGLKEPYTVRGDTTLQRCIQMMQNRCCGSVLVTSSAGKIEGIFTERDCLMKVIGRGVDLETATVAQYMTRHPVCERAEASLAFAMNLMSNGGFRHIPIIDQDNVPIGIVSVKDLIDHMVKKMLAAINEAVDQL